MDCNLELKLSPPSAMKVEETPQEKKLTIFYKGQICVADVTEIQARAIIWEASKQMREERYKDQKSKPNSNAFNSSEIPISPAAQLCTVTSTSSELSMKKSLLRFLEKRRHRHQANLPYHNNTIMRD